MVQVLPSAIGSAGSAAATQTQMETATDNATMATPLNVNWHPGAAKAWVKFNSAGTIAASWNITSITDNGAGDWTVNIGTDFSSADYCGQVCAGTTIGLGSVFYCCSAITAGTFRIRANDYTGAANEPTTLDAIFAVFFGDQ